MKQTKAMLADLKKTLNECSLLVSICHNCKFRCNFECRDCSISDDCMTDEETIRLIKQDFKKLNETN